MRFVSLAVSRKTQRRVKILLVLGALCGGFLLAAEGRYAVLRIKNINVSSQTLLPETAVWGTLTAREEEFWPAFWADSGRYTSLIETYFPVQAKLSLVGWGKFRLDVKPLAPSFKLFWAGKYWYVALDGRAWLAELPNNKYIATGRCDTRPAISWGGGRATPIDLASSKGNVYVSSLPVGRIMGWYRNIDALGWTSHVKYIQATIREGIPVVRVILFDANGGDGANLLFVDDPPLWYEAELAVMKLYGGIGKISPKIFIDTTYKGKILVKNIVK